MGEAGDELVDRLAFRAAMARLGAAVHVVTTDGAAGRAGFTASAVCSVSDAPPTLLVCLNRAASVHAAFAANRVMCVNTLGGGHEALSDRFGGETEMAARFDLGRWGRLRTGAPVLEGAVTSFDCRVAQVVSVGTHDVLIGEVMAIGEACGQSALLWLDRRYHRLG